MADHSFEIKLIGSLNEASSAELNGSFNNSPIRIVVDMSEVSESNTKGLMNLVVYSHKIALAGGELIIRSPSVDLARTLFELRLDRRLKIDQPAQ